MLFAVYDRAHDIDGLFFQAPMTCAVDYDIPSPAIIAFAQEVPGKVGMIAGLFCGLGG